ncbi:ChaN family lipoprotein [Pseudomonas sp. R5(2019)]|uniref:ChaN family lipoprotein n=1 Tax=Pseudomonas sp. R5(2019) TaxID=2697566 RepID=UPI0014127BBA|nr:ChaN family lipoprotein [Pseudomonas sp. R5(2019)]NBA98203.1 iron(III) ABC transporter [Pseudomonas sp. R5(2019)]
MSRLILKMALLILLSGCQTQAPLPPWQSLEGRNDAELGVIRNLADGQALTPDQLVKRLAAAPWVLVGEQHDNPDHHALQLWLLKALEQRRAQGSVLLEMLTPSQQARVDKLKQPDAGVNPEGLPAALDWQESWDWAMYGPIVKEALAQPYPLLAANLDDSEIRQIFKQPPTLKGEHSTAAPVKQALLEEIRQSHCGLLPEAHLPAMLAVQQQRDRRIAERLAAAPQPALLLAGGYHVRKDIGVPVHLFDLGAGGGGLVLMFAQVGGEKVTPQSADFVWYTAALPEQDYCATMRKGG